MKERIVSDRRISVPYEELPRDEIEVFWAGTDRYDLLLVGYRALRAALGEKRKVGWMRNRIAAAVPSPLMVPTTRTLRRFGTPKKQDDRPMQGKSLYLSGLLLACNSICREHQGETLFATTELKRLNSLAEQYAAHIGYASSTKTISEDNSGFREYEKSYLQAIYENIVVPQEDDPRHPEFPPYSPRFPATPMESYDFFGRNVFIKDESHNPTGSHKDRWALEILYEYKKKIGKALETKGSKVKLRSASMISSGSGALALQHQLRLRDLPNLRVVMANNRPNELIATRLRTFGAIVVRHDLDTEELDDKQVLKITKNENGFDVTTRNLEDPHRKNFYDWLCYEILSATVKHIFVPVGTGDLFANIIGVIHDEVSGRKNDPRLKGAPVKDISVYGATTRNEKSQMDKLYAKYRPTLREVNKLLSEYKEKKRSLGPNSEIFEVSEERAEEAYQWAQTKQIRTEHSGCAGLALFLEMKDKIPVKDRIAVVNTGWLYLPR
jgi:threonine dehydratase